MRTTSKPDNLMASPYLYPFVVNWWADRVQLIQVSTDFYTQAAFLDQRAFAAGTPQHHWAPISELREQVANAPARPLGLIFHIGHCGSTLISRMLGLASEQFFSVREPLPLRDLAGMWPERDTYWSPRSADTLQQDMDMFHGLWARTPGLDQLAIVKATSFCSLLAEDWLQRFQNDRAVMLAMAPEIYLATVLGAESYVLDLLGAAKQRLCSLHRITGADLPALHSLSSGELAAACYLAEMVNMEQAAKAAMGRILRVDFDSYLKDRPAKLAAVAQHFGRPITDDMLERILANPVSSRYSKATEYGFSAQERRDRLQQSRTKNGGEINKGLSFLTTFAKTHGAAKDALINFGYAK
ncbi:hypothetical protein [Kordiimonas sp.]|uniref:hypothetical protein n=1 Tax=Kordiimonas sp. TaxID=1970157 RepID=UPI003A8FB8AB